MTAPIALVALFTFIIHLIASLSLGVRIVGLRTLRWAVSFALFNVMVLVSRLANTFQAPLLAKTVEKNIQAGQLDGISDFHWIIGSATLATLVAGLLFPSFQRLMTRAVDSYYQHRSVGRLLVRSFSFNILQEIPTHLKWPDQANWQHVTQNRNVPLSIFLLNVLANAIMTISVLATLYAGYLNPGLCSTAASMSGLINGLATIILVLFIDPTIALLADEVGAGRYSAGYFRRYIILILFARLLGTILAQFLLVPFAYLIIWVAEHLYG